LPACSFKGLASAWSATSSSASWGRWIAGFLFPMLGIALTLGGGLLGAIILAFIGAVILLVIVKVIKQITA